MNYQTIKKELEINGYVIIPNILEENEIYQYINDFYQWKNKIPQFDKIHKKINPFGICRYHQIGHQPFIWNIRIHPKILKIFQYLWNTEDLIVSYDGVCYIPETQYKNNSHKSWIHVDQAPIYKEFKCYQSFISFTDNQYKTLVVYQGSHLLFQEYFKNDNITQDNWKTIDYEYLEKNKDKRKILNIKKGDLVIWDSRTFHQCQYGDIYNEEFRLVQYLSYYPKHHIDNTIENQEKRKRYFIDNITTSHWCAPIIANPLQPSKRYKIEIDYNKLFEINLKKNYDDIIKLV